MLQSGVVVVATQLVFRIAPQQPRFIQQEVVRKGGTIQRRHLPRQPSIDAAPRQRARPLCQAIFHSLQHAAVVTAHPCAVVHKDGRFEQIAQQLHHAQRVRLRLVEKGIELGPVHSGRVQELQM